MSVAIVVDDDLYSLETITDSLMNSGLKVLGCSNLRDGISFAKRNSDVVLAIIDVRQEYASELSLIDVIREYHEGTFVVLTGEFKSGVSAEYLDAMAAVSGASLVLRKPVTAQRLVNALRDRFP